MNTKEVKAKKIDDDILSIVEKFILHFESVDQKTNHNKEDEDHEYSR